MHKRVYSLAERAPNRGVHLTRGAKAVSEALNSRVVLVQADAGWGKTTAVRDALANVPHVWCDVGVAPREKGALAFSLARALELRTEYLGSLLLEAERANSLSGLLAWLMPRVLAAPLIVLDDLHAIGEDHVSLLLLLKLVSEASEQRFVLISRPHPALEVDRWRCIQVQAVTVGVELLRLDRSDICEAMRPIRRASQVKAQALLDLTSGYPAGVHFALALLNGPASEAGERRPFTKLATHFFYRLEEEQKQLLLDLSLCGAFDGTLIRALGYSGSDVSWLLESAVPIQETGNDFRIHDLFADLVRASFSDAQVSNRFEAVYAALVEAGRVWQAFDFASGHAPHLLENLLLQYGPELFESGRWSSLRLAIAKLPKHIRTEHPAILGMRAWMEHSEDNYEAAEELLKRAIASDKCDESLKAMLLWKLADLYNSWSVLSSQALDAASRALVLGSPVDKLRARTAYCLALSFDGQCEKALAQAGEAIRESEELDDAYLLWTAYDLACYTANCAGEHESALNFLRLAIQTAQSINNNYALAISYSHLGAWGQPWSDQVEGITKMAEAAADLQNPGLTLYIDTMARVLAAQRADEAWMARLDAARDRPLTPSLQGKIADAMRLAWNSRFAEAYHAISSARLKLWQPAYLRRWHAAIAMFAALAGEKDAAYAALSKVFDVADPVNIILRQSHQYSDIHCAFAEVLLGRKSHALRRLPKAPFPEAASLCEAVRAIAKLNAYSRNAVTSIASDLAQSEQEGMAKILAAWASTRLPADTPILLTVAELEVLRALAAGSPAKAIALETGRSIETIRNHTKSIIRKLGVSGRLEAVASARRRGFL